MKTKISGGIVPPSIIVSSTVWLSEPRSHIENGVAVSYMTG